MDNSQLILNKIAQAIYDRKGKNIVALDIAELTTVTEKIVIAEGNVDRHNQAIARDIIKAVDELGIKPAFGKVVGKQDWVVLDFIDVMVHILTPAYRQDYKLEELWKDGKILHLDIDVAGANKDI